MRKEVVFGLVIAVAILIAVIIYLAISLQGSNNYGTKTLDFENLAPLSVPECIGQDVTCYVQIAINQDNPAICNNIEDGSRISRDRKFYCYNLILAQRQDVEKCAEFPEPYDSACFFEMAKEIGDVTICDRVKKDNTRGSCYGKLVSEKEDVIYCEKIVSDSTGIQSNCFKNLAVATLDFPLCERVRLENSRNECYLSISIELKDTSMCDKIDKQFTTDYCYQKVAIASLDPLMCEKVRSEARDGSYNMRDMCYYGIAIVTEDYLLCDKMVEEQHIFCYSDVAEKTEDTSICDVSDYPGYCYERVAKATKNAVLCDNARSNYVQACINDVNKELEKDSS